MRSVSKKHRLISVYNFHDSQVFCGGPSLKYRMVFHYLGIGFLSPFWNDWSLPIYAQLKIQFISYIWVAALQNQQNGMCAQWRQISLGIRLDWSVFGS